MSLVCNGSGQLSRFYVCPFMECSFFIVIIRVIMGVLF